MIDTDLIDLKILPSSHIVFKDFDAISKLQVENKSMKNIFVIGLIIFVVIQMIKEKKKINLHLDINSEKETSNSKGCE